MNAMRTQRFMETIGLDYKTRDVELERMSRIKIKTAAGRLIKVCLKVFKKQAKNGYRRFLNEFFFKID